MRQSLYNVYRNRQPDNAGGWTLVDTVSGQAWGYLRIGEYETVFVCGAAEDVRLEDVIEAEERHWRVVYCRTMEGSPMVSWAVELTDRPQSVASTTTTA